MKPFACVLLGLAALAALAPAAAADSPGGAPSLFLPQRSFEFAPVVDGAKVVHDFTVMNRGSAPLTIENVRTG